jgi:hypothetical protein
MNTSPTSAPPNRTVTRSDPGVAPEDAGPRARELEVMAEALPILIARDDDPPALWLSASFATEVAAVRSSLASIDSVHDLATRSWLALRAGMAEVRAFEAAARSLAGDATCVGLAIRWLEIQTDSRLPAWPELLRRRPTHVPPPVGSVDAALWFG